MSSRKSVWFVFFVSVFLGMVILPWSAISADTIADDLNKNNRQVTEFSGEKLTFDISFLWFTNAAEGSILLKKKGKGYVSKLKAETKGFIGFFTGYVKHFYLSRMKVVGEEKGLQPFMFEKNILFRGKDEKVITTLDYKTRTMPWQKTINGIVVKEKIDPIPPDVIYYDVLSAFYNFRAGFYGEIEKGKDFVIHAIPEKEESKIFIHVCTREEEIKLKKEEKIEDKEGYFFVIKVPKEIFKTKTGEVSIWATKEIMPLKIIVRDYIAFGDIRGTLRDIAN